VFRFVARDIAAELNLTNLALAEAEAAGTAAARCRFPASP
jgi:hypothetical protein